LPEPKVLKQLKKNSSEEIWIAVTNYKDRELLDMRVYYRSIDDMQMKPTKRGVSVPLAKAGDLLEALEKIETVPLGEPVMKIEKSETETVYVAMKEFKGLKLVDVRTYFRPPASEDMVPSQKGVSVRVNLLDQVKDALREAKKLSGDKPA
jgi:hypothetical protein